MATIFGLTAQGFLPMTQTDIRNLINERIWRDVSPFLDLSDRSWEGQLVGIVSELCASAWDGTERVNSSQDPDKAMDAALDAICVLSGTFRIGAKYSTVVLTITGDPSTVVSNFGGRVPGGDRYNSQETGTITLVDSWASTTGYTLDERVTNGGNVYQCTVSGTSASTGPVGTDPLTPELDGATLTWRFLGPGTGAIDLLHRATDTGPLFSNSGTITEIVTPLGGVLGVVNVLDVTPGRNQMGNPQLRVLREQELASRGTSPVDAIGADLLQKVTGVTSVTVFMNTGDITDSDGVPPHSVECMVTGGADQDIWDQLRLSVSGGIRTHGDLPGFSTDSYGTLQVMKFSRPDPVNIYVSMTVTVDADTFPDDGETEIKDAIVKWGNAQKTGKNAVSRAIGAQAITQVSGVLDTPSVLISIAPSPTVDTTIQISRRQQAVYDTSRIAIVTTEDVP